jgi:hypothetical protein
VDNPRHGLREDESNVVVGVHGPRVWGAAADPMAARFRWPRLSTGSLMPSRASGTGPTEVDGVPIEGTWRGRQVPWPGFARTRIERQSNGLKAVVTIGNTTSFSRSVVAGGVSPTTGRPYRSVQVSRSTGQKPM